MTVQIEFWQLISALAALIVAFLGFAFTAGRLLLSQIDRRLDERFVAMEGTRKIAQGHWDERFATVLEQAREDARGWQRLERDFLEFRAELPTQYVRREDYIRNQTVIEAKLDAVALRIENWQLKGAGHGG